MESLRIIHIFNELSSIVLGFLKGMIVSEYLSAICSIICFFAGSSHSAVIFSKDLESMSHSVNFVPETPPSVATTMEPSSVPSRPKISPTLNPARRPASRPASGPASSPIKGSRYFTCHNPCSGASALWERAEKRRQPWLVLDSRGSTIPGHFRSKRD